MATEQRRLRSILAIISVVIGLILGITLLSILGYILGNIYLRQTEPVSRVTIEEGNVDFGMEVRSPSPCSGSDPQCCNLQRHYAVNPTGMAAEFNIKDGDQLLAVNSIPLVDKSHEKVLQLLNEIHIGQIASVISVNVSTVEYGFSWTEGLILNAYCTDESQSGDYDYAYSVSTPYNTFGLIGVAQVQNGCVEITGSSTARVNSNSLTCTSDGYCRDRGLSEAVYRNHDDYFIHSHDAPSFYIHADCSSDTVTLSTGFTGNNPYRFYVAQYDILDWWNNGYQGIVFTLANQCGNSYKFIRRVGNGVEMASPVSTARNKFVLVLENVASITSSCEIP